MHRDWPQPRAYERRRGGGHQERFPGRSGASSVIALPAAAAGARRRATDCRGSRRCCSASSSDRPSLQYGGKTEIGNFEPQGGRLGAGSLGRRTDAPFPASRWLLLLVLLVLLSAGLVGRGEPVPSRVGTRRLTGGAAGDSGSGTGRGSGRSRWVQHVTAAASLILLAGGGGIRRRESG